MTLFFRAADSQKGVSVVHCLNQTKRVVAAEMSPRAMRDHSKRCDEDIGVRDAVPSRLLRRALLLDLGWRPSSSHEGEVDALS